MLILCRYDATELDNQMRQWRKRYFLYYYNAISRTKEADSTTAFLFDGTKVC